MENQVEKTLEMKAWTSDIQRNCQIIAKLNKDLESLRESKEKMELELNAFKAEKLHKVVPGDFSIPPPIKSLHEYKEKREKELNDMSRTSDYGWTE